MAGGDFQKVEGGGNFDKGEGNSNFQKTDFDKGKLGRIFKKIHKNS